MKFSIIIPVYNVEKYIDKCLKSIVKQSYKNYEVIIVNDGTKDNSVEIITKYTKKYKNFKLYNKENGGLSDARNYGLNYVTGDYLLFIDSDDYINKDLLKKINEVLLKKSYDIVKFKIDLVDEAGNLIRKESGFNTSKKLTLKDIFSQEFSEPAWTYCYNLEFWNKNNFKYAKGKIHEDFGLSPLVLLKSKSIYYINYYGYNYVQRMGSIVNGAEKNIKRTNDMIFHFDYLKDAVINDNTISQENKNIFLSYISNGVINKGILLDGKDLKNYIKELKKRNVFSLLLSDTYARKIKKILIKLNPYMYIKILSKRS